jgi:hypothetical protein
LISSPRIRIAATMLAATSRAPSIGWRCVLRKHAGFRLGVP